MFCVFSFYLSSYLPSISTESLSIWVQLISNVRLVDLLPLLPCSADLQNAIESENYALAAKIRDEISNLEAESLAASAKALAYENAQYAFRLGQKVRHKTFGI